MNEPHVSAPLNGRRILLTRAKPDDAIARALRMAGAQVDTLALTVSTPLDSAQLDAARTGGRGREALEQRGGGSGADHVGVHPRVVADPSGRGLADGGDARAERASA